jgi:hypothetical protein
MWRALLGMGFLSLTQIVRLISTLQTVVVSVCAARQQHVPSHPFLAPRLHTRTPSHPATGTYESGRNAALTPSAGTTEPPTARRRQTDLGQLIARKGHGRFTGNTYSTRVVQRKAGAVACDARPRNFLRSVAQVVVKRSTVLHEPRGTMVAVSR